MAAGLGSIYGGASVCAWYPITPSTSVAEAFETHANRLRIDPETGQKNFAIIQAEDELACESALLLGRPGTGARFLHCN